MAELRDIARTLRSKNADPFITTCDVFVTNEVDYRWLKASNLITPENVARVYGMPVEAIIGIYFIDNIRAVKLSFFKTLGGKYIASGDLEDLDLVGAQQHVPLLRLPIPDKQKDE